MRRAALLFRRECAERRSPFVPREYAEQRFFPPSLARRFPSPQLTPAHPPPAPQTGDAAFGEDSVDLARVVLLVAKEHGDWNLRVHALDMCKRLGQPGRPILVTCLLDEGKIWDAIFFCKGFTYDASNDFNLMPPPIKFWTAVVATSTLLPSLGEKSSLFYHLYSFLREYSRSSVESNVGKSASGGGEGLRGSWKEQQKGLGLRMASELGKEVEMLGKKWEMLFDENRAVLATIKTLFGFMT